MPDVTLKELTHTRCFRTWEVRDGDRLLGLLQENLPSMGIMRCPDDGKRVAWGPDAKRPIGTFVSEDAAMEELVARADYD